MESFFCFHGSTTYPQGSRIHSSNESFVHRGSDVFPWRRNYKLVQAYRPKFRKHPTYVHAAFWRYTLKFDTRILFTPAHPLPTGVCFFIARYVLFFERADIWVLGDPNIASKKITKETNLSTDSRWLVEHVRTQSGSISKKRRGYLDVFLCKSDQNKALPS